MADMVDYKLAYKRFIDKTRAKNKKDGYKTRADFDSASSKNLEIQCFEYPGKQGISSL